MDKIHAYAPLKKKFSCNCVTGVYHAVNHNAFDGHTPNKHCPRQTHTKVSHRAPIHSSSQSVLFKKKSKKNPSIGHSTKQLQLPAPTLTEPYKPVTQTNKKRTHKVYLSPSSSSISAAWFPQRQQQLGALKMVTTFLS